jgi:DNA sulfur modification protein DndD
MIRIERIAIKNFRQYRSVDLQFDDTAGVCFFTGKNGIGKSNFMNAVCWCLYGETPFKSENVRAGEEKIVNELAITLGDDEVEVSITAIIDGEKFRIMRHATSLTLMNPYIKHQGEQRVYKVDKHGNAVPLDYPELIIADLLPFSLSRLFIFDGEVIRKLFAENYNIELRENIYKVANVDILKRAITDTSKVIRGLERQRTANAFDSNFKQVLESSIDKLNDDLTKTTSRRIELDSQITEIDSQIDSLNDELLAYQETEERTREKLQLEQEIRLDDEAINDQGKKLNDFIVTSLPFAQTISRIHDYQCALDKAVQEHELPPAISPSILHKILDDNHCICGQQLNDDARNIIKLLTGDSERTDELSYLMQHNFACTAKLNSLRTTTIKDLDNYEGDIYRLKSHREDLQTKLHIIEEELRKSSSFDNPSNNPQVRVDELRKNERLAIEDLGVQKNKEESIQTDISAKQAQIEDIIASTDQNDKLCSKVKALETAQRAIGKIETSIINQTRDKVSCGIIETFKQLHWKPEFKSITLDDNFNLTVLREDDTVRKLGDLSVGERKMLGISIINALSKKLDNFDFPFFIDSPTEELDGEVVPKVLDNLKSLSENKQVFVMTLNKPEITEFLRNVPPERKFKLTREDGAIEVTSIARFS